MKNHNVKIYITRAAKVGGFADLYTIDKLIGSAKISFQGSNQFWRVGDTLKTAEVDEICLAYDGVTVNQRKD